MVIKARNTWVWLCALTLAVLIGTVCVGAKPAFAATDDSAVKQTVISGQLIIYKYDAETGLNSPQGGATWGGSHEYGMDADSGAGQFTITNTSKQSIVYTDDYGHLHTYASGQSWTINTHYDPTLKAYVADTPANALPYGTYHVQETKAPAGYGLASAMQTTTDLRYLPSIIDQYRRVWVDTGYDFSITENNQVVTYKGDASTTDASGKVVASDNATPGCYNPVFRSGIEVVKRDHDLRAPSAQGNATLSGATFKIYNDNTYSVKVLDHYDATTGQGIVATPGTTLQNDADADGMVAPGGLVATITSGDDGRAETFMDSLPAGWYKVVEVTAPWGYSLEQGWTARVQISGDDNDNLIVTDCDDPVLRDDVTFAKVDAFTGTTASGDSSFAGAEFSITYESGLNHATTDTQSVVIKHSKDADGNYVDVSKNVYVTNQNGDSVHVVSMGGLVATVKAGADGTVTLPDLPVGTYSVTETKAPEGYTVNSEPVSFTVDGTGAVTVDPIKNTPIDTMSVTVQKRDAETGLMTPSAGATFEGAVFGIYNDSKNPVAYDANGDGTIDTKTEVFGVGARMGTATTDASGKAAFSHLYYGTYQVKELKAPKGYMLDSSWSETVVAHEEGKTYDVTCDEYVIREDISFTKTSSDGQQPMANIPFLLTSKTTGESHILVTDEDGMLNTTAYMSDTAKASAGEGYEWRLHTYNTNLSDAAYNSTTGVLDATSSSFGFDQGYWFYGVGSSVNTSKMTVDDTRGAIPYDTYTLTELRAPANKGYDLISRTVTINRFNNDVEDLGTLTNSTYTTPSDIQPPCGTDLEVSKSSSVDANTTLTTGQDLTYTFDYLNDSADDMTSARIRDYVPTGLTFKSATGDGVYVSAADSANGRAYVEWTTDAIKVGGKGSVAVTFTVTNQVESVVVDQGLFEVDNEKLTAGDTTLTDPAHTTNIVRNSGDGTTPASALEGVKSVNVPAGTTVKVGDKLTYSIKVTNKGGSAAKNVAIYDEVPNGTTIATKLNENGYEVIDASDGGYQTGNGIGWKVASLAPGESYTASYTVTVTSASYDVISNQAAFGFSCGDPSKGLCSSTNIVSRKLERVSHVTVAKTSDAGDSVSRGQVVTYTLTLTNDGNGNATNVNVWDVIPSNMQYVANSVSTTYSGTGATDANPYCSWVIPTLAHDGGTATVTFKARVMDTAAIGSTISNTAVIGGTKAASTSKNTSLPSTDGTAASNTVTTKVVDALADGFTITKTEDASDHVSNGDTITYTINWKNNGSSTVNGFAVQDVIPDGTTFVPGSIVVTGADGKTSTDVMAADKASAAKTGSTVVDGTATSSVWYDGPTVSRTDPSGVWNAVVQDSSSQSIDNWDTLAKTIASAKPGDTFDFVVKNTKWYSIHWTADVKDDSSIHLRACIIVPSLADSANYTYANGIYGSYDASTNSVFALQPTVKPDEGGTLTFKVKVNDDTKANTTIANTFTYGSGTYTAPTKALDHKGNTVTTTVGSAELTGAKTVTPEGTIAQGDKLTYTVSVTNGGSAAAKNVAIFDAIAHGDLKGVTLVPSSVTIKGGTNARVSSDLSTSAKNVSAMIDSLAPGETATLSFQVEATDVMDGDVISNYGTYAEGVTDVPTAALANKTNTVENTVGVVNLSVVKTSTPDDGTDVAVGDTVKYSFTVTNSSAVNATDVAVYDAIPAGTTLVSGSASGLKLSDDGTYLYADGMSLAAGKSTTFTFDVTVNSDVATGTIISNRATAGIFHGVPTGALAFDSNEVTHQVAKPDVNITKTVSPSSDTAVAHGDELTYTIHVSNDGTTTAKGVGVYDAIPAGTTFVSATGDGMAQADGYVSWFLGDLKAGESRDLTLVAKVSDDASGIITNTASWGFGLTKAPTEAQKGGTSDTASSNVQDKPDLSVVKTVSPSGAGVVSVGDTLTYTVTATNNGSTVARGVDVYDAIPAGTTYVDGSVTGAVTSTGTGYVSAWLGNVKPGASASMSFQVKVTDEKATLVENTATWGTDATAAPTSKLANVTNTTTTAVGTPKVSVVVTQDPVDGALVTPGDTIHYTVTATNVGDVLAQGLDIYDAVPAGTTYVAGSFKADAALTTNAVTGKASGDSSSTDATVGTGTNVTNGFGAIDAALESGDSVSFSYDVTVNAGFTGIATNEPTYQLGDTAAASSTLKLHANDVDALSQQPTLTIVKGQTPTSGSYVAPGDTITYTVTVKNTGKVHARDVGMYDVVPDGTTYVADSLSITKGTVSIDQSNGLITGLPGTLEKGESVTFTFKATVNLDKTGIIHNRAMWVSPASAVSVKTVDSSTTSDTTADTTKATTVTSATMPELFASAFDISPVKAFATDVTDLINPGKGTASGISEDSGATGTDTGTSTGTKNDTGTSTGTKTDTGTSTGTGSSTGTKTDTGSSTGTGTTVTPGTTTGTTTGTGTTANGSGTNGSDTKVDASDSAADTEDSNETEAQVKTPTLSIVKSASVADGSYVQVGDDITYTLAVKNTGVVNANSVVISDAIPTGMTYVADSATATGMSVSYVDGAVVATGSLKPADTATISFHVTVDKAADGTDIVNGVKWGQSTDGKLPANPKPGDNEVLVHVGTPSLAVTKSASVADGSYVRKGDEVTYTLVVANNGTKDATNVVVTDVLPAGLEFVSGGSDAVMSDSGTVTVKAGDIAKGATASYTFVAKVTADDGATVTNKASVASDATKPVDSNSVSVTVGSANVSATKTVAGVGESGVVQPGDTLTYTVTLTNAGSVSGHAVATDKLPAGVTFQSGSEGVSCKDGVVTYEADVAAAATASFDYKVTVNAGTEGTKLSNGVSVTTDGGTPSVTPPVDVTVGKPALTVTKTSDVADGTTVKAGDTITYSVVAANTGTSRASDLVITDTLPKGTTFVSASVLDADGKATDAKASCTDGVVSYSVGALEAGAKTDTLTIKVTVDADAPATITNAATATCPVGSWDSNKVTANVDTFAGTLTKTQSVSGKDATADAVTLTTGEKVAYTVTYTNTSAVDETGIVLYDVLPQNMTLDAGSLKIDEAGTDVTSDAITTTASAQASTVEATVLDKDVALDGWTELTAGIHTDADGVKVDMDYADIQSLGAMAVDELVPRFVSGVSDFHVTSIKVYDKGASSSDTLYAGTCTYKAGDKTLSNQKFALTSVDGKLSLYLEGYDFSKLGTTLTATALTQDSIESGALTVPAGKTVTMTFTGTATKAGEYDNTATYMDASGHNGTSNTVKATATDEAKKADTGTTPVEKSDSEPHPLTGDTGVGYALLAGGLAVVALGVWAYRKNGRHGA